MRAAGIGPEDAGNGIGTGGVEIADAAMNEAATAVCLGSEHTMASAYARYVRNVARIRSGHGRDAVVPATLATFRRRVHVVAEVLQAIAPGRLSRRELDVTVH